MPSDITENTHHCGDGSGNSFHAVYVFNLHKGLQATDRDIPPEKECVLSCLPFPMLSKLYTQPFFLFLFLDK